MSGILWRMVVSGVIRAATTTSTPIVAASSLQGTLLQSCPNTSLVTQRARYSQTSTARRRRLSPPRHDHSRDHPNRAANTASGVVAAIMSLLGGTVGTYAMIVQAEPRYHHHHHHYNHHHSREK